jgi:CHAD domain-containing protein
LAVAFAFERGERFDVGARRLAREGAELVLSAMHARPAAVGVHEARRTLKRLRALVRLIAPSIDARRAQAQLRAASHDFADSRDATVMLETFDRIGRDEDVRKLLVREKKRAKTRESDAVEQLNAFVDTLEEWQFDGGFPSIEEGVRRTYRAGRRTLADARELHELRKRTKDLQHQLSLLREAFPPVISGYLSALRKLGSLLGDEHDLTVLGSYLETHHIVAYRATIAQRRVELRKKILPLAGRIYVDPPRVWTARLRKWWES